MPQFDHLRIQGAREHNLKNINVDIPRDSLVVFTGLSGSGKSSLAFDTIFAEGQRRYVESLSAYARQFLGQMEKPDLDHIEGLSPSISIDQKGTSRNPRSTVGTVTEVFDYMRLLWARVGHPHCPNCGRPIEQQTPQQMADILLNLEDGTDLLRDGDSYETNKMAGHMIAGQIAHASAMSAVLNTTVNSYKRLSDGHRAPAWATWARISEASLLRIPSISTGTAMEIELRSPDAMANPYLAVAVALGTAVSGIEQELDPPEPFDENLVHYHEEEFSRLGVERLPQTLGSAIDILAQDETMRAILGDYIVDQLVTVKRAEWDEYRRHVSPWEHEKYGGL